MRLELRYDLRRHVSIRGGLLLSDQLHGGILYEDETLVHKVHHEAPELSRVLTDPLLCGTEILAGGEEGGEVYHRDKAAID